MQLIVKGKSAVATRVYIQKNTEQFSRPHADSMQATTPIIARFYKCLDHIRTCGCVGTDNTRSLMDGDVRTHMPAEWQVA